MAFIVTIFKNINFEANLFSLNIRYAYFSESATALVLKKQPPYFCICETGEKVSI